MQISKLPAINPSRSMVVTAAAEKPVEKPVTETAATDVTLGQCVKGEESRLKEQQRIAQQMLSRLGADTKLAAVMLNPILAPHAHTIAWQATGRAIYRYETETPRRSMNDLLAEEQTKARQAIMALPKRYLDATGKAINVTGDAIANGARVTGDAIATGARATGDAVVTGARATGDAVVKGAKATKDGVLMAGAVAIGGAWMAVKACLKGLGSGLSGIGDALQDTGSKLKDAGE